MTHGELFDNVKQAAEANHLALVSMTVEQIGFHFIFEREGQTIPVSQRRRQGWSLNHGDLRTHSPLSDYLKANVGEIAMKLNKPDALADISFDTKTQPEK